MANIFDQLEQAAAEGGASEPFNYAMDRLPSMGEAAGGGAYMGANYLAPETVDYTKQLIDAAKEQYIEPARQQFNEMLQGWTLTLSLPMSKAAQRPPWGSRACWATTSMHRCLWAMGSLVLATMDRRVAT